MRTGQIAEKRRKFLQNSSYTMRFFNIAVKVKNRGQKRKAKNRGAAKSQQRQADEAPRYEIASAAGVVCFSFCGAKANISSPFYVFYGRMGADLGRAAVFQIIELIVFMFFHERLYQLIIRRTFIWLIKFALEYFTHIQFLWNFTSRFT